MHKHFLDLSFRLKDSFVHLDTNRFLRKDPLQISQSLVNLFRFILRPTCQRSGASRWPQTRWVEESSFSGIFSDCRSLSFYSPCLPLILQRLLSDLAFLITFPIGEGTVVSLSTGLVLVLCINDCYDPQEPTPAWIGPLSSVSESRGDQYPLNLKFFLSWT